MYASRTTPTSQSIKVSFQSPVANAWGASFCRYLKRELEKASKDDAQQSMERVCNAAQLMFNARVHTLPDVPSYTVLGVCALILSAYRELVVQLGSSDQSLGTVERGFAQAYQAFIRNICQPLLQGASHSCGTLAEMNFAVWSKGMYNTENPEGDRHALVRGVNAAGYALFLREQGEPGLAKIIHEADQAWIHASAAYACPQLNERRRARASDTGFCPFRFDLESNTRKRVAAGPEMVLALQINTPVASSDAAYPSRSPSTERGRDLPQGCADGSWTLRNPVDRRQTG